MAQPPTQGPKAGPQKPPPQPAGSGSEITKLRDLLARQEATRQSC